LHTRHLAAVLGHSGSIYKASLKTQPERFIEGMEPSGSDPFRGYIARSPKDAFTQLGDLSCPSLAANVHRHCNLVQSQFFPRQLNYPRIRIKRRSHAVYIDDARAHRARRGGAPEWIPWLRTALRAASSATAARRERDRVNKPALVRSETSRGGVR
jgi:hypothetical protein